MTGALRAMCRESIVRRAVSLHNGEPFRDAHGQPVLEEGESLRCYFERGVRVVRDREGNLVPSTALAVIDVTSVHPEDQFEFDEKTLRPIAVAQIQDPETGELSHVEVSF